MKTEKYDRYENGAIRFLNGKYKDMVIVLQPFEELLIGRDVKKCNIILEAPWVSRVHCIISYDKETSQYQVVDCSENGTFFKNANRLLKRKKQRVVKGTIIEIGKGRIQVQML